MRQDSFSDAEFEKYRKEQFLEGMASILPCQELCKAIDEPFYSKHEGAGRRPTGLNRILRIHFIQHRFELYAKAVLYNSRARAKLEHQFTIVKRQFGFSKVLYRGMDKNTHCQYIACALSNLVMEKGEPTIG